MILRVMICAMSPRKTPYFWGEEPQPPPRCAATGNLADTSGDGEVERSVKRAQAPRQYIYMQTHMHV